MAHFFVGASSQKIVSANLPAGFAATWAAGQAITLACWHMPTQNTANADMLWVGNPANVEDDIYLEFSGGGAAGSKWGTALAVGAAGSVVSPAHGPDGSGTTFRWHHSVGTLSGISGTNAFAFTDGIAGAGGASTTTPALASVAIGVSNRSVPRNFYSGWIALPAIWNVVLSNNEIMALARGAWPGRIRPQNLVFFVPDITGPDAYDLIQHNPLTVTGATFASNNMLGAFYQPPRRRRVLVNLGGGVSVSATQVAATLTLSGGTQVVDAVQNASVSQVAATLTLSGGTQVANTNASVAQVAANLTLTGGTQAVATVRNASVAQIAAALTINGGTQVVATVNISSVAQVAAVLTLSGGTQVVAAGTGSVSAAVAQVAAALTLSGGTAIISSATGPLPSGSAPDLIYLVNKRKIGKESSGNIYLQL